ncbi:putative peptide modification system cyclase [Stenotrophomonas sp. YAU14D1_LEIMI4_1]|uniref:putative peptide modification system cyclase n=1 Tax=Stenotrophomonas sp. YAU14D1_LEIMI4_1 TaxID=2072407 RepID=UPI000D53FE7C|nr:putative peptide modification system cyclase [Stenotrophomonas sp. YAU14D1_LEIMI4_1]AWH23811.1 putative peptide modification system cyclase [Stenotrophomonas sp. YAU14D1_LEIMI4_1]
MNGDTGTSTPHTTQLRALLFTDLCDSTQLVERMGDTAAAELFQDHDRLVMALQQRWNGQQIDRSDGLFMLFERPVDALGFALDYQRGLQALGGKRSILLRARMGLHVGEVLLWNNSAESIALGAKPVEVEGLAKPMAARLMQLARPGQLLLSAAAESMARRAVHELGDAGQGLKWKSYGRWRFKGVAQSMEVFGLQDPTTVAPGRPRQSGKATRDIPLWRQPLVMTAQVGVVAALLVGGWFLTRPQPAIAFAERDWVVLAGLRNLTSNPMLDDALDQAFRISLEQSRYVNIVSDDRIVRTLEMMRKPLEGGVRERSDAAAVAMRAGARLLFVPSATDVGGRTRFSVEVVEPSTLRTLTVVSADARPGAVLAAVDDVSRKLRDTLGEETTLIQRDSHALPEVTTGSMDALRAFALGQKRYVRGDYKGALAFYRQATDIDPQFALAWLGQSRSHFATPDFASAGAALAKAAERTVHLPARETFYVRAWMLQINDPDRATDSWLRMAEMYPDYLPASNNAAMNLYNENRLQDALPLAQRVATSQVDLLAVGQDQYGRILLGLGRYEEADRALALAAAGGWQGALTRQATVAAARGDFRKATQLLDRVDAGNYHADISRTSVALDQGDTGAALAAAARGLERSQQKAGLERSMYHLPLAVSYLKEGKGQRAIPLLEEVCRLAFDGIDGQPAVEVIDRIVTAQAAALVALRLGNTSIAHRVQSRIAAVRNRPDSLVVHEFNAVIAAEDLRHQNKPLEALKVLDPFMGKSSRVQTRVAALHAARAARLDTLAQQQLSWLRARPGLAYAEIECAFCLQGLNILDVRDAQRAKDIEKPQLPRAAASPSSG